MEDNREVGKNVLLADAGTKEGLDCSGHPARGSRNDDRSHDKLEACDTSKEPLHTCKRFSHRLLTVCVPKGRGDDMRRLLNPILKHAQRSEEFVEVEEKDESIFPVVSATESCIPKYMVSAHQMTSPGFAVILFLPEIGPNSAEHVKRKFQRFPWRHHHTIQLQRSRTSGVVGKQDFYFLSRTLPLWCVCPAYQDVRKLRVNVFVRHYSAMVEFYRLVSGTEMESSKPGFCLFPLRNDVFIGERRALECELALKRCPYVKPYPLTDAYLTFPVTNLVSLRTILPSYVRKLSTHHYLVHDPDGNAVILHDVSVQDVIPGYCLSPLCCPPPRQKDVLDKASVHSDSIDSGRFSDFDACSSELDQCMSKLIIACSLTSDNSPLQANAFSPDDSDCTLRLAQNLSSKETRMEEYCAMHGTENRCKCWPYGDVDGWGKTQDKSNEDICEKRQKVKIGPLQFCPEKTGGKKKN